MLNISQRIVAAMEARHKDWQVWYVPRATQPTLYCARRWDGTGEPINSEDPGQLASMIEQESG
jgi:hypothetical protein